MLKPRVRYVGFEPIYKSKVYFCSRYLVLSIITRVSTEIKKFHSQWYIKSDSKDHLFIYIWGMTKALLSDLWVAPCVIYVRVTCIKKLNQSFLMSQWRHNYEKTALLVLRLQMGWACQRWAIHRVSQHINMTCLFRNDKSRRLNDDIINTI